MLNINLANFVVIPTIKNRLANGTEPTISGNYTGSFTSKILLEVETTGFFNSSTFRYTLDFTGDIDSWIPSIKWTRTNVPLTTSITLPEVPGVTLNFDNSIRFGAYETYQTDQFVLQIISEQDFINQNYFVR